MQKIGIFLLSLLIAGSALAGDSGLYFNKARNGEGISLYRNGDTVVFFLFTYGGLDQEIGVPIYPWVSPTPGITDPQVNGQRWFLSGGVPLVDDSYAEGILYQTAGINYPTRLAPNGVGGTLPVANFLLERSGDGWDLLVVPLKEDNPLEEDDVLFTVPWSFETLLFRGE